MALGMTVLNGVVIEAAESVALSSIEWASDTGGTVLNAASGEWFQAVQIQVSVTFHASATGDCLVHLRKSADGGTTEDTEEEGTYAMTIPVSAGNTVTKSLMVYDFDYLDVGLENEDSTYTASWSAKYAGTKITGMATS
jgi:hypothetical protein